MTDPAAPPDDPDEVARAVRTLMPALRRQAGFALAAMALAIAAAAIVSLWSLNSAMETEDRWKLVMLGVLGGGASVIAIWRWAVRRQEAAVMPILARSIGLTYGKDASRFVKSLPKRLLPERSVRSGEDHVHGILGAHAIQMAEVTVETGGKSSRILFRGIVAQFPNRTAMPAFFIALEDKTRPGLFFGGELSTEGLHHLRDVAGGGRTYGIWTSWTGQQEPPALAAVIDILTRVEHHIGPGAELYAATSNGEEMHLALSHRRNLFRFASLLPGESELFADVQTALHDLSLPLKLARTLIAAEEIAAGTPSRA